MKDAYIYAAVGVHSIENIPRFYYLRRKGVGKRGERDAGRERGAATGGGLYSFHARRYVVASRGS